MITATATAAITGAYSPAYGSSLYDSTARLSKERYSAIRERYLEVGERIERVSEHTGQNRGVTKENNRLAVSNTDGIERIKQVAEQVKDVIKENEKAKTLERSRSRGPSMGR